MRRRYDKNKRRREKNIISKKQNRAIDGDSLPFHALPHPQDK